MAPFFVFLLSCILTADALPPNDVSGGEWESRLARMEAHVQDQIQQLKTQNDLLKSRIQELKAQNAIDEAENEQMKQKIQHLLAPPAAITTRVDGRAAARNCLGLTQDGQRLSGLYMVQSATNQIQTVYCEINQATGAVISETVVGYNDIKSSPIYFYVQRNSVYSSIGTTIPYNVQKINIGNAFNLATGTFTAPKPGRYFFTLSGLNQISTGARVFLFLNGVDTASSFGRDQYDTYALQATLDLKVSDRVTTFLSSGSVGDTNYLNMHFTGMLLEEDLPAV